MIPSVVNIIPKTIEQLRKKRKIKGKCIHKDRKKVKLSLENAMLLCIEKI